MKKLSSALIILAVIIGIFAAQNSNAQIASAAPTKNSPPPGVQIAQTLSTITGVAISPLLGVSAVGCYQYCKAQTDEERAKLPWFANPLFWVPAFLLVVACFLKDTAGTALPPGMKKPFDVAETIEHKISGLVATGAFVPIMVNMIHEANSTGGQPSASLSAMGFAAIQIPHWLYDVAITPIAMAIFFIVFLASNAIQILILISPFGVIDAALKSFRTSILASVAVSSWMNPWFGAIWAVVIILISWLIAGWSFRLSHFGLVFLWDYFTVRKSRFQPDAKVNKMFLSRKINKVPARTYGKLLHDENGALIFHYQPWLILPRRTLVLPVGKYETGRGIFYSEILHVQNDSAKTVILLPPRYLGHETTVATIYNFTGTRDIGLRAAWAWFKSLFSKTKIAMA
jgi:MFS family permease